MLKSTIRGCQRAAARLGISSAFCAVYMLSALAMILTTLSVRRASSRDPGSLFFQPDIAYAPQYSAIRQLQAQKFLEAASETAPYEVKRAGQRLCVGIPSIARNGTRYLRTTIASLLAGLTQAERDALYLVAFIPHTDPTVHPAYREAWMANLVNEVLLYHLSAPELDHIRGLEEEGDVHREKGLFDYTYLLKACHAKRTPYIAIIEDDVVAMDGWYHRTMAGLQAVHARASIRSDARDFLYLRMFHTEAYLGWNREDWPTHVFWSLTVLVGSALAVFTTRSLSPRARSWLPPRLAIALCTLVMPWLVLLVFAAGKATVFPLPAGVAAMNRYGCCAQGLVFPRDKAWEVVRWFEASRVGFADMLIEQYADEQHQQRWALVPSVLQHVGSRSSKGDDFGPGARSSRSVAESIWNFRFELGDAKALRREHELLARASGAA